MSTMTPFVYRDFYDVPRMIIVRRGSFTFLLDSSFNEEKDDYDTEYSVFLMPELNDFDLAGDWRALKTKALQYCGNISISKVCFDPSKRKVMDTDVLSKFLDCKKMKV